MGKLKVEDRQGIIHELDADQGSSVMEIIRDAGLDIEAACGGCCACATCHVYINEKWISNLNPINEDEDSMLDQTFSFKKNSRLSCQIEYTDDLDGMELTLAPE